VTRNEKYFVFLGTTKSYLREHAVFPREILGPHVSAVRFTSGLCCRPSAFLSFDFTSLSNYIPVFCWWFSATWACGSRLSFSHYKSRGELVWIGLNSRFWLHIDNKLIKSGNGSLISQSLTLNKSTRPPLFRLCNTDKNLFCWIDSFVDLIACLYVNLKYSMTPSSASAHRLPVHESDSKAPLMPLHVQLDVHPLLCTFRIQVNWPFPFMVPSSGIYFQTVWLC